MLIEQLRERHRFAIAALASQIYVDLLSGAASENVRADLAKDALAQVGIRARLEPARPAPGADAAATPQPPIQVQVVVPADVAETLAAQSPVAVVPGPAAPGSAGPPSSAGMPSSE